MARQCRAFGPPGDRGQWRTVLHLAIERPKVILKEMSCFLQRQAKDQLLPTSLAGWTALALSNLLGVSWLFGKQLGI